mmetsp:Transcript_77672/g.150064  ORF Transcript_77672/g.150064 Transcript_77672/m.150064 type:complete len:498 (+) Transcript_77672:56-1549(+)
MPAILVSTVSNHGGPRLASACLGGILIANLLPYLLGSEFALLVHGAWCWQNDGIGNAVPLNPGSPTQNAQDTYFSSHLNGCCTSGSSTPTYFCYSKTQCASGAPANEDALKAVSRRPESCSKSTTPAGLGEMLGDYCPVSDVVQHSRIALDIRDVTAELNKSPPDFTAAKKIYKEGKNSMGSSGKRTLLGMASRDSTGEVFFDTFVAMYGSAGFQEDFLGEAFDGTGNFTGTTENFRVVAIKKALLGVALVYASHELESAQNKAAQGMLTDNGAPHAWDEGWAFLYGVDGTSSAYEVSVKRDKDYTGVDVAPSLAPIFNEGLKAVRGSYNAATARAAANGIYNAWVVTYLRAAHKYSYKMQKAYDAEDHIEAYTYWRTIAGWAYKISATDATTIEKLLAPTVNSTTVDSKVHCKVKSAAENILGQLGFNCDYLAGYYTDNVGCSACSFSGAAKSIRHGISEHAEVCHSTNTELATNRVQSRSKCMIVLASIVQASLL